MKPVSDLGSGVFLGKVTQEFPQSFAGNRPRWASCQGCFGTPELSLLAFNSVRNMSGNMVLQIWNSWIPVEWDYGGSYRWPADINSTISRPCPAFDHDSFIEV